CQTWRPPLRAGFWPCWWPTREKLLCIATRSRFLAAVILRDHVIYLRESSSSPVGSGLHFQDDFQFDRRTEWQARNTKDKARRDGPFAEDVSKQPRRGIGDLWVLRELRRRGDVHAEPHDAAHAVQRT